MKVLTNVSICRIVVSSHAHAAQRGRVQEQKRGEELLSPEVETHIMTNPLKRPNNPAFTSQKLLTHTCMHRITATPIAGISRAVKSIPSINGESG